MIVNWLNKRK
ncbi:hypothetical protein ETE49_05070 [Escherichia coli]|nr:hypothetical protein ETE49_05070 [Escherichia coli]